MRVLAGVIIVAAVATPVVSQVIEAKARLTSASPLPGGAADRYVETAIAVSRFNPNRLVTCCNWHPIGAPDRKMFYGISTSGVMSGFSEKGFLPSPTGFVAQQWFDPIAAASHVSDTLWIGSVFNTGTTLKDRFAVWRSASGTGLLEHATPTIAEAAEYYRDDKGALAVGPVAGLPDEHMYLAFTRPLPPPPPWPEICNDLMMWDRWTLSSPPSLVALNEFQRIDPPGDPGFPYPVACDRRAIGVAATVIPTGPRAGRLVVAYRLGSSFDFANPIEWTFNDSPTVGSPNGWSAATTFGPPGYPIQGYNNDSLPGSFVAQNYPSITFDPTSHDVVYIAFAGSSTPAGVGQNVDLYVAKIQFGDPTIVEVRRITDSMLGEIEGAKQFFPAVTVDGYGGINLAYVRMPEDYLNPTPDMQIMYVRMPN